MQPNFSNVSLKPINFPPATVTGLGNSSFTNNSQPSRVHRQFITVNNNHKEVLPIERPVLLDLEKCSRAMGITEHSLQQNRKKILEVSQKVVLFLNEIYPLIPSNFSAEHRNPCWTVHKTYKKHKQGISSERLRCIPYFFLAGFPKSATTSIHHALEKHPQIQGPVEKEPHFWARVQSRSKSKARSISTTFINYTLFFKSLSTKLIKSMKDKVSQLITYDGSQSILWDSNFFYEGQDYCAMPAVFSRVMPNAKFIVVMRNPVTRLFSHFQYSCTLQQRKRPPGFKENEATLFHSETIKYIETFRKCLKNMTVFECTNVGVFSRILNNQNFSCGKILHKVAIGTYAIHIKKWLQFYPIENFLFLKMEDISEDPSGTMSQITQFLGIDEVPREKAQALLGTKWNTQSTTPKPMDARTKSLLEQFYQPYNQELAEMLNDKRFLWN